MQVSIMIEGQMGLTWPRWTRLAREVERLGYAGLFRSDHFINPSGPPDDSLEMVVSLAWLASNTERLRFGPLVAPVSFRDPIMFTRQAAALAEMSDGRMTLGLGAGWMTQEHEMFGYELSDVPTRSDRLAEAVEVASRLLRDPEPVTFEGRFYHLIDAVILPRSASLPICIGGNGERRTLPLVARFADEWNSVALTAEAFRTRNERLDMLLAEQGRGARDVKRTMMLPVWFGVDDAALDRRLERARGNPAIRDMKPAQAAAWLNERGHAAGTSETILERLGALQAAGVEEVMLQWLDLDDLAGIEALAAATVGADGSLRA